MKKKLISFAAACLALTLIVGSWAYYTSTSTVQNELKTQKYGTSALEKFTPPTEWKPGAEITKEYGVKNTGDYDVVVRVKLNERWWRDANNDNTYQAGEQLIALDSTGNAGADRTKLNFVYASGATQTNPSDGLLTGDQTVVYKKLAAAGWTLGSDGYWYYNTVLTPDTTTTPNFMDSITMATNIDLGKYNVTNYWTENATISAEEPSTANIGTAGQSTTKWVPYTGPVPSPTVATNDVYTRAVSTLDSTAAGYAGAVYDLFITSEVCQATLDAVNATWGMTAADLAAIKTAWSIS